jgi:hypothetical protein
MQVRDGYVGVAPSRRRDGLPTCDVVAAMNHHRGQEGAGAQHPAAVVDRQEHPAADLACERHDPTVGSQDHRLHRHRDIDASMARAVGIVRRVEAADDRTHDGPLPRRGRTRLADADRERADHDRAHHDRTDADARPHARDGMPGAHAQRCAMSQMRLSRIRSSDRATHRRPSCGSGTHVTRSRRGSPRSRRA